MARKHSGISVLVIASLAVLGLVAAYFVTDFVLRGYAEKRVRQEIVDALPAGVSGDITVAIGGISVIEQYLAGSFERIDVRAPHLKVFGELVAVQLAVQDVPVDRTKAPGPVHGAVDVTESTLEALLPPSARDSQLTLGDGTVTYTGSLSVLGLPVEYRATATPTTTPGTIVLKPTSAEVGTSLGSLDVGGIVKRILGEQGLVLCVGEHVPKGVELTGVTVVPGRAHLTFEADHVALDGQLLTTHGSCGSS